MSPFPFQEADGAGDDGGGPSGLRFYIREFEMNFSVAQWLLCFVLDFFLKASLFSLLVMFVTLGTVPFSSFASWGLGISMFNFLCLFLACSFAALFSLPHAAKRALVIVVANVLFIGCVLSYQIWAFITGQYTGCAGDECNLPKAEVASHGLPGLAIMALVLFLINLLPILISVAAGRLAARIRRSFQKKQTTPTIGA